MNNFEDLDEDFRIDYSQRLGSGAFGDVYKGIWKSKNCLVAVKRIKDFVGNAKAMIKEEVRIMKTLEHPNLLKIYKVIQSKEGTYLIIQYCDAGNLQKQIKGGMPEVNCLKYLKQIVDGMVAVNKANHIHRDLKPQNILFTTGHKLKICDFGLARKIIGDDPNQIQKFSAKGTPLFSSPQVLKHHKYSGKCDVWSAGAILVQMLTKINPFHKAKTLKSLINYQDKLKTQGHFVLQGNYNPWFKEVVSKMLAFEEDDRWSFYQLQEHIDKSYEQLVEKLTKFDSLSNPNSQQAQQPQSTQIYPTAIQNLKQNAAILKGNTNQTPQVHGGKISRQQQKLLTRQKSRQLLTSLKLYIEFLYNRGKIFAEIGTKYFQSQKVKKQNGWKFMVLFLAISTFIKSIQKILNTVSKEKQVSLPDGTLIVYSALDQQTIKQFDQIRKGYENQMNTEINKFKETIQLIWQKMNSQKYRKIYPSLMSNHKNLLYNISDMKNGRSKQTVEYYENQFRFFFKTQCLQQNPQKLDESYLRIYYVCVKLANINQCIPLSRFKDNYIINQVIEDSSKLTVDKIREQIVVLNSKF